MSNAGDYQGKAPLFQKWDEMAFLRDTLHMRWLARLIYKDLLTKAWYGSERPDLPSDDAQLSAILGVPPETWAMHRDAVRAMFQVDPGTGHLFQNRLRRDWENVSLYRASQQKNIKKRWASRQSNETKEVDTTVLPPNYQGNTRRGDGNNSERTDDVAPSAPLGLAQGSEPSASLGVATPPVGKGTPTPANHDLEDLIAHIAKTTSFVPPDPKAIRTLLSRFKRYAIEGALEHFLHGKPKAKLLGAIKVFFTEPNGSALIQTYLQNEWKQNLTYMSTSRHWVGKTVEEFLAEEPIPAGLDQYAAAELINQAEDNRAEADQKWYAEHPQETVHETA
jgi:uncharacterized protein YdaU (DUF1376 family)